MVATFNVFTGRGVYSSMRLLGDVALRVLPVVAGCALLGHGNVLLTAALLVLSGFVVLAYAAIRMIPF